MGSGSFNAKAYRSYAATTSGKTTDEIYTSRNLHKNLDPRGVKIRESRDSADNPNSTPIIAALDVTGSMGMIADVLAREGLGTLFTNILDRKSVTNPHLMFMGVGDANCDSAPLQVSQFEADNRIVEQLTQLWIEHGGGGNSDTNHETQYQGKLRFAPLDCSKLLFRCASDAGNSGQPFKLVLTHCDQLEPPISSVLYSNGPTRNHISTKLPSRSAEVVTVEEVL